MILRTRAFTLIELVVVMVITSIITTAAYFTYRSAYARLIFFEHKSQQNVDLSSINTLLNKDFFDCVSISPVSSRRIVFNSLLNPVEYIFEEDVIYRKKALAVDTFNVITEAIETIPLTDNALFADGLIIKLKSQGREYTLAFQKQYDPIFLLNLDTK